MEKDVIYLSKSYLRELGEFQSRKLVGKICKRCEMEFGRDKSYFKNTLKELIYENMRDFFDLLLAYEEGIEFVEFKLKSKEK